MTFLAPGAAIVAGAVALPVLVALYMLKLRRRPLRVSSTAWWASATHDLQVNVPLRWIRVSLLFLLHLLIVACFVAAIGRPAVDTRSAGARLVVIVIDHSASMSAADAERGLTRLGQAQAGAIELVKDLDRASSGTSVCVVQFAAEATAVVGPTEDLRTVEAAIAALTPTDQPGDIAAALKLVSALVAPHEEQEAEAVSSLAVVYSDGAFASDTPIGVGNADLRFVRCGPAEAQRSAAGADNVGIVGVSARRDERDPSTLRIFARLQNAGATPRAVALSLSMGGKVVERRAVTLPPPKPGEFASAAGVTFVLSEPAGGIATVSLVGSDLLAADDAASLVIRPALRPRILLVSPEGDLPPDAISAAGMLADVLEELRPLALRRVTPKEYAEILGTPEATNWDLTVLDRTRPAAVPPTPTISFGAGLPIESLEVTPRQGGTAKGTYVLTWRRTHPLMRDVGMDTVYIADAGRLPQADGAPGVVDLARGTGGTLIRLREGDGPRRIVAAFELAQSNWPLQPSFSIFLANAVDLLTGRSQDAADQRFTTAAAADLPVPAGAKRLHLTGPEDLLIDLPPGDAARRVAVGPLELAGVYEVRFEGVPGALSAIAVNLVDPGESALATHDVANMGGRSVASGASTAAPTEIWHWFVAAAGGLLILEWIVFALRSRA